MFAFGDVFTTDYPSIGVAQGGTVENFVENYNRALQMTTPNTIFVPGHAQFSKQEDIIAVRDAITTIHARFLSNLCIQEKGGTFNVPASFPGRHKF